MNKLKRNLLYNVSYQVLLIIVPLIISPYLSKTIGAEGIGIYSYTYSVAYYFMMFTMLGINYYGTRAVAKCTGDEEETVRVFSTIYRIQFTLTIISVLGYVFYCQFLCREYSACAWCQLLCILSYGMDISWLYFGKENFKSIVWRNAIVKASNLILVLTLVKKPSDVWIYTLIMAAGYLMGQALLWPSSIKYFKLFSYPISQSLVHIKGIVILFLPILAMSIYSHMDKIMLGNFCEISQNGYYECSEKIINIPRSFIQAVGGVMLPHTAAMLAKGLVEEVDKSIQKTFFFVQLLAAPFVFGLIAISGDFSVMFWGKDFAVCGNIIAVLTPALLFSVLGNIIRTQFLVPKEMDREYTTSFIMGAVVNVVVNLILIRYLGAVGAAIGTVAAEITLCMYQFWVVRKQVDFAGIFKRNLIFYPIAFLMLVIIKGMTFTMATSWLKVLLMIAIGIVSYMGMSLIVLWRTKDEIILECRKDILKK